MLIGDEQRIRAHAQVLGFTDLLARAEFVSVAGNAAETAERMAREGTIDILMKGHLRTDELLHPVLDHALLEWVAKAKRIEHLVAEHADCLMVLNIETGNLLAKSIIFLAGFEYGHIVVGVKVPILIPSRVENAQDKVSAMALGVLYASR